MFIIYGCQRFRIWSVEEFEALTCPDTLRYLRNTHDSISGSPLLAICGVVVSFNIGHPG